MMKFLCAITLLAAFTAAAAEREIMSNSAPVQFVRRTIAHAAPRPAWWRVRPDELAADLAEVKKGKVEVIARTPGGFPFSAVTYGPSSPHRELNWPSATGSPRPELYAGNAPEVVMIAAGIHGEETEGVVLVQNLISLLETGRDLRGVERPHLLELCSRYRLVLLPCVNMDGRAVAPDCLNGCTPDDYAPISTILKDGRELRWPELKEYYPMPMAEVAQLGTYYNSAGYNIQLDAAPGNLKTAEGEALLRLADRERIDFFLNLHSAREIPHVIPPSGLNYPRNVETVMAIRRSWMAKQGLTEDQVPGEASGQTDINNAVTLATGAAPMTFEFAALKKEPFENKLECGYRIVEAILEHGLHTPLADRRAIIRGNRK